jgi:ABC-type branched-subunit amino acid transport system substrate-binding protein
VIPSIFHAPAAGEKGRAFQQALQRLDPEPPTVPEAANYYDIVYMIEQSAEEAGISGETALEEARHRLRERLAGLTTFEGVVGTTAFLPNGDARKEVFALLLNGDQVELLS